MVSDHLCIDESLTARRYLGERTVPDYLTCRLKERIEDCTVGALAEIMASVEAAKVHVRRSPTESSQAN